MDGWVVGYKKYGWMYQNMYGWMDRKKTYEKRWMNRRKKMYGWI